MGRTAVAVAATLVGLAFAMSVFERWLLRRRPQDLAWSFSLLLFAVAGAALTVGAGVGWDGPTFRVFYLFGAILNVPFLAIGTVYLLAGRRAGDRTALGVSLAGAFAVGVVVTAPFRAAIPADRLVQGSAVFGVLPRVLAGVASAGGALVILAGAVWSMVRRRGVLSNGLIAGGTLMLGASGVFNSVFDAMSAFAVSLLVGITLIFGGFVLATSGGSSGAPRALSAGPAAAASPSPTNAEADRRT